MWDAGEVENMGNNSTLSKSLGVGLGVIGVNFDVDCTTNIYMRRSKLPRTSMTVRRAETHFFFIYFLAGSESRYFTQINHFHYLI